MGNAWEWAKSHPLWIAGGVLFGVILIWWLGSGGSSAATPQSGIFAQTQDPNVVAANAAQQVAQTNANAGLAAVQLQTQADTTSAQLQASTLSNYFTAQQNIAQAQYTAMLGINSQNTTTALGINEQNITGATALAQTAAQSALALQTEDHSFQLGTQNQQLQSQQLSTMGALATQALGVANTNLNWLNQNGGGGSGWQTGGAYGGWASGQITAGPNTAFGQQMFKSLSDSIANFRPNMTVTHGVTSPLGNVGTSSVQRSNTTLLTNV